MRDLETSLITLINGQESKVVAILEKTEIERMFEIGRAYGFKTVCAIELNLTIQQVAVNQTKGISMEIFLKPVSVSQALVSVTRITNPEERIKEMSEYIS